MLGDNTDYGFGRKEDPAGEEHPFAPTAVLSDLDHGIDISTDEGKEARRERTVSKVSG